MIILDIETRPNEKLRSLFIDKIKAPKNIKDPEKIEAAIKNKKENIEKEMSLDPDFCEVICVGIRTISDKKTYVLSMKEFESYWEKSRIDKEIWITYNGKAFDLPALIKTIVRKGYNIPIKPFKTRLQKFNAAGHIDLQDELNVFGKTKSLDTLCQIYLGEKKNTLTDEFFRTATDEEIKQHCKEDLLLTERLFIKFKDLFV